jgi:adenine/guanine phosphoribosyltransferase-like PRPP-binding protein
MRSQYQELLTLGAEAVGHLKASDQGFATTQDVKGKRVLLVDDTYTSGATAQSAASSLALGGAEVVAIIAIGRVIQPEFSDTVEAFWKRQQHIQFTAHLGISWVK